MTDSHIVCITKEQETEEILLRPNPNRFTTFPIVHKDIWDMYKKHEAAFWTAEEVDLSKDKKDWDSLTSKEQHFLKYILAFFAASDGIVVENLAANFIKEVQLPEARTFFGFQIMMENIHSEMYSLLLDTYVTDNVERNHLLRAIQTIPCIKDMADWALRYITNSACFAERLLAFAAYEGVLFSGAFCAIFWMKKRQKLPGLTFSNEFISRDEGMHCAHAALLDSKLKHRLNQAQVERVFGEATTLAKRFICEAIPCDLIGMNKDLMSQYIEFAADRPLKSMGYKPLFNATNPFDWMEMISMERKSDFFISRVGDYKLSAIKLGANATEANVTQELSYDDE
jgi:ribonucleotide reductase beta subunit family protein with ferritin-like domain